MNNGILARLAARLDRNPSPRPRQPLTGGRSTINIVRFRPLTRSDILRRSFPEIPEISPVRDLGVIG